MYRLENPSTPDEKRKNKEIYELAEKILAIRKSEFYQGKYKLKDNKKGNILLFDFYKTLQEERYESKGNYGNWDAAFKHLKRYAPENIQLKDIDTDFVRGFRRYLDTKAKTKSNTPLSQNSKYTYFNKLKAALREAYNENYIDSNVIKSVKGFEQAESQREYLTYSEL